MTGERRRATRGTASQRRRGDAERWARVDKKLQRAIDNNHGVYEVVFAGHGIRWNKNPSSWYCLEKVPPLYSNLVTRSAEWRPDGAFRSIDKAFENEQWENWSIKDSFAALDLGSYGFEKLFDAQWLYLEASRFAPEKEIAGIRYELIRDEDALCLWRKAWDADEALGNRIFHPSLLRDPRVHFVAGYVAQKIVSGCLVNKTEDVLGISNCFCAGEDTGYWSDMISFIHATIERADIVGYERSEPLVAGLRAMGFEAVGNLTVWLKKRCS
jgi:hypothetical protein